MDIQKSEGILMNICLVRFSRKSACMWLGSSVLSVADEFVNPFQGSYAGKFTIRRYARKKLSRNLAMDLENNVLMLLTHSTILFEECNTMQRSVCNDVLKLNGFKFMWNLCQLPVFQSVQLAAGVFGLYLNSPLDYCGHASPLADVPNYSIRLWIFMCSRQPSWLLITCDNGTAEVWCLAILRWNY